MQPPSRLSAKSVTPWKLRPEQVQYAIAVAAGVNSMSVIVGGLWCGARPAARSRCAFAGILAIAAFLQTEPARADCTSTGATTVSCTGTTTNYQPGNINNFTITIQPGAKVVGGATGNIEAIFTTGATNSQVINLGLIDGPVSFVGAGNTFTNSGIFQITNPAANLAGHSISGDYIQTAAATLALRFDTGFFDQLLVTNGDATLAGKLILVPQAQIYTAAVTYDFIRSIGGVVNGTFGSVTSSSPFFTVTTDYSSGTKLDVTLTPIAFNAVAGLTPNQRAVANALQANFSAGVTGNAATLYSNLFTATSVSAFDRLSGEGTAATQSAAFSAGGMFLAMLTQPPGSAGGGVNGATAFAYAPAEKRGHEAFAAVRKQDVDALRRWQPWANAFGAYRTVAGNATDPGSANVSQRGGGGAFGVGYSVDPGLTVGFAIGASTSHFSVDARATNGDLLAGHLGVYGTKQWGALYAAGALTYARIDNDTTRTIAGIGTTEIAKGSFASDMASGKLELGWRRVLGQYTVTPFAGISLSKLWQRGYSENSTTATGAPGVFGLNYGSQSLTSLPSSLGAQFDSRFGLANGQSVTPFVRAAWLHEFKPDSRIDASFISVPGAAFTVIGARAARDAAKLDAGVRYALNASTSLVASINGEIAGSGNRSYAGSGGLKTVW